MNLTEPQAGSDLGALTHARGAARRRHLPHLRPEDLHHLWRARPHRKHHASRAGAPARCARRARGASRCSWCRRFSSTPTASSAQRNDVFCASLEHKLGIHGSPTCTMIFGDGDGADRLARRRGEPRPRLHVHHDEQRAPRGRPAGRRAWPSARYQQALRLRARAPAGPRARRSGEGMSPIIEHPDVRRMLLTMRALTAAARAICYMTGAGHRPCASRRATRHARRKAHERALAADAGRQGVLDRHRHRGRLARRAGARRHGLHRGDRRGAAPSRCAHRRRSTRAPTASRRSIS